MDDEGELRELICEVGHHMWTRSMVAANDGNISVRLDDDRLLCTPTGVSKGMMRPEMLVVVGMDGEVIGSGRPSSEIRMHFGVYQADPGVRAVVHAHPPFATLYAVRGEGLVNNMMSETVVGLGEVPLAPYATPSTQGVAEAVKPLVVGHRACLLEHHGALSWAGDLLEAYLTMERLESSAHLLWAIDLAGGGRDLPADEIARLQQMFPG